MSTINLSERAAQEVKKVMEEQKMTPETHSLRVGVAGSGCSGFSYSLNFEEKEETDPLNDEQFEIHGIQVRVDRKSAMLLEGTEIDFKDDLNKRGFAFDNPLAVSNCGCGSSFSI
jgi:iron-sulfur cluster assembly protein